MDDYTNNKFTVNFQEHVNDHKEAISYPDMTSQTKERIGCHWQNFFAISAIFRMFFLCFSLVGIIASAVSKNQDDNGYYTGYATLRIAYLVFSCITFIFEAFTLFFDITNVFNIPTMRNFPINIVILITDCILFFAILICSIFAFTKAQYIAQDIVTTPWGSIVASNYFKADAFYVMAIVGYLMSMLFVEEIIYLVFQILARYLAHKKAKSKHIPEKDIPLP